MLVDTSTTSWHELATALWLILNTLWLGRTPSRNRLTEENTERRINGTSTNSQRLLNIKKIFLTSAAFSEAESVGKQTVGIPVWRRVNFRVLETELGKLWDKIDWGTYGKQFLYVYNSTCRKESFDFKISLKYPKYMNTVYIDVLA